MMKNSRLRIQKLIHIIAAVVIASTLATALFFQISKNESTDYYESLPMNESDLITNEITLKYCTWDEERFYMEPIVNAFNATYSGIHIEATYIDSDIYDDNIGKLVEKADFDIIGIRGFTKLMDYQKENVLIDITQLIQNSDIDVTYYGNMYNNVSIEGNILDFPHEVPAGF